MLRSPLFWMPERIFLTRVLMKASVAVKSEFVVDPGVMTDPPTSDTEALNT